MLGRPVSGRCRRRCAMDIASSTLTRYSNELAVGMGMTASVSATTLWCRPSCPAAITVSTRRSTRPRRCTPARRRPSRHLHDSLAVPVAGQDRRHLEALLTLVDEGYVRVAGVSNFKRHHLQTLYDETGRLALNQIQCSPVLQRTGVAGVRRPTRYFTLQAWHPTGSPRGCSVIRRSSRWPINTASRPPRSLSNGLSHGISIVPKSSHEGGQIENADPVRLRLRLRRPDRARRARPG